MKNELLIQEINKQRSLDEAFAQKPHVRARLLAIADMIDQAVTEGCTAHEAEARAMEQLRKLGNEVLTDWALKSECPCGGRWSGCHLQRFPPANHPTLYPKLFIVRSPGLTTYAPRFLL